MSSPSNLSIRRRLTPAIYAPVSMPWYSAMAPSAAVRQGQLAQPKPEEIPAEFRPWLGHITEEKTIPQIQKFLAAGGSVVTIGSSHLHGRVTRYPP